MRREYYALKFYLDGRVGYVLWSTSIDRTDGDKDEVFIENGFAPCFKSASDVKDFATEKHQFAFNEEEPLLHNLEITARWLRLKKMKRGRQWNPEILAAWNVFADLARRLDVPFSGNNPELNHIYSKLFWGQNLLSMTPKGCFYVPVFSNRELQVMHDVLSEGLRLWRGTIRNWRG